MIWVFVVIFNLFIGVFLGVVLMYYRNRNLLTNQKNLYSELQNNKIKLNEYQKRLNSHFTYNIELLNKIAENYQQLYQNITKDSRFFLPHIQSRDNIYEFQMHTTHSKQDNESLSMEAPLDYSENTKVLKKNYDT